MAVFLRLLKIVAFVLVPAALVGLIGVGTNALHTASRELPDAQADVVLSFGLSRDPLVGSTLIDVCASSRAQEADAAQGESPVNASLVENSRGKCVQASSKRTRGNERDGRGRQGSTSPPDSVTRPAILATTVLRDLAPCGDEDAEPGTPGEMSERFPANQVTATSELVGATGLRVIVSANAGSPVEAPEGVYCGTVVTERAAGPYSSVPIAVRVQGRGGASLALVALYILYGALAGIAIRFLSDPTSKLIGPYRRLRAAQRWVESLPVGQDRNKLSLRISETEAAIWYLDPIAADESLTFLESARTASDADRQTMLAQLSTFGGGNRQPIDTGDSPVLQPAFFALLRNNWWIALLGVAVAVVATGVWTLYAQNTSFDGGLDDWVKLAIFGLGAQVTTGTLAEALGKLQPSARTGDR